MSTTTIRAAGGVVWRTVGGRIQVCLVHRPRYDDWSLPKGKLDRGEHPLAAAVREVVEETGVRAQPQLRLPSIRYRRDSLPKVVDYWSMRALSATEFTPNSEVDRVRWLAPSTAVRTLTYAHDAQVLRHFASLPRVTSVVALVRHGRAGKRGGYPGDDTARPLDAAGRAEARQLAALLSLVAPERLVSASVRRCTQTLEPVAARLGFPVEVDSGFDEPAPGEDPARVAVGAASRLRALAVAAGGATVCSQGKVIPPALAALAGIGGTKAWATPKGTGWLLAFAGTHLAGADRLTP
ncbi:NUDIX domain-containing protein [Actinomycetes bacterium KLBMP 9797]